MTILVVWVFTFTAMVGGYEGMSVATRVSDGRVVMPTQASCEAVRTDLIEMDQVGYGAVTQETARLCVKENPELVGDDYQPSAGDRGATRGGY